VDAVNYLYVVSASGAGGESTDSLQTSAAPLPSSQPTNLVVQTGASQLQLSWPQSHLGWRLRIQTNNLRNGVGADWGGRAEFHELQRNAPPHPPPNGAVFLRLVNP